MFGSLIVQLPAQHTGGDLIVELGTEKRTIRFADDSNSTMSFAGFFADCEHTLLPVASGLRLVNFALLLTLLHLSAPHLIPSSHPSFLYRRIIHHLTRAPMRYSSSSRY